MPQGDHEASYMEKALIDAQQAVVTNGQAAKLPNQALVRSTFQRRR